MPCRALQMISALGHCQACDEVGPLLWTNNSYEGRKVSLETVLLVSFGARKNRRLICMA